MTRVLLGAIVGVLVLPAALELFKPRLGRRIDCFAGRIPWLPHPRGVALALWMIALLAALGALVGWWTR